jgi:tetratricopeptide (TPR) repeat protein
VVLAVHASAVVDNFAPIARPATDAYRADVAAAPERGGDAAAVWLTVASLVEHAALVPEGEAADVLGTAIGLALEQLGEEAFVRLGAAEWGEADRVPSDAIVLLTDAMQSADLLNLAASTLDSLLGADRALGPVQRGRILAKRARVAWKLGMLEEADARYRRVEHIGRSQQSAELKARAAIGFVALAQLRGNYPDVRRHARRAVRLAEQSGLRSLIRNAHSGMLVAAAVARSLDEALVHGWQVYRASLGDPVQEAEVLQNLGQALLDSGHTDTARAVFASVVSRRIPPRILLPALGGLALASGDEHRASVRWAARQARSIDERAVPRYALASALVECAIALARIGDHDESEELRAEGLRIARAHGFHEVVYRAEDLEASVGNEREAPAALRKRSAAVVRELEWMEPEHLPERIALAVGSSSD